MTKISKAYANPADAALLDTLCAVNNARQPARAAMDNNALAHDFILAAQVYQVELHYARMQSDPASPLRQSYEAACKPVPAPVRGEVPDLLKNRIQAELALLETRPQGFESLDRMIETGRRYMRTRPDLALTLDLPLPEKLWNQVKRGLNL